MSTMRCVVVGALRIWRRLRHHERQCMLTLVSTVSAEACFFLLGGGTIAWLMPTKPNKASEDEAPRKMSPAAWAPERGDRPGSMWASQARSG